MKSWARPARTTLSALLISVVPMVPSSAQTFTPEQAQKRNLAHEMLDKANLAMKAGDFATAADILQRGVQIDDSYSRTHANLGWALMKLGRNEQAVGELHKAISLEPNLSTPWGNLAPLCFGMGDMQGAIDAYEHYIALEKDEKLRQQAAQNLKFIKASLATKDTNVDDYVAATTKEYGHLIWNPARMPLKVFIDPGFNEVGYKPQFSTVLTNAFMEWGAASGGRITFMEAPTRESADILCSWTSDRARLGDLLGEGGVTKFKGSRQDGINHADILILTVPVSDKETFTPKMLRWFTLHEVGHALGLHGHSPNPGDIMFFGNSDYSRIVDLSQRDKNTISRLYGGR